MQSLRRRLMQKVSKAWGHRAYSIARIIDSGQPTAASHPELLKVGEITPGITCEEYVSRRKGLLELLPEKSIAIIASAPVKMMTDVVPYTFRQDADYLYITGCQQPDGIAVLGRDFGLCMFMPEPSLHDVTWQGQSAGVDEALHTFKADQAFPMSKLHEILPRMIEGSSELFHNVKTATPAYKELDAFQNAFCNGKVKDLSVHTHEIRWVKSPAEISLMRESASVACQSLLQTMFHSKAYPHERMLAAKVEYECKMRGAQRMAFNPVVGGGANASVIHYSRNDQKVKNDGLVLMDIGCELHGYVSDLTRTWPPCGKFSSAHVELYNLILETNKECLKLCRPGISIRHIHNHSVEMLQKGLKQIGILKGDRSSYQKYHQLNPTNIGHYVGMDVHDCSLIGNDCPLKPGVLLDQNKVKGMPIERIGVRTMQLRLKNLSGDEEGNGDREVLQGFLLDASPPRMDDPWLAESQIWLYLFYFARKLSSACHDAPTTNICWVFYFQIITIEPGIYIPSFFDTQERYRGVGMRIEDEVLITETGYEVLTASMPKEINHIETLLNDYCHSWEPDSLSTAASS